MKNKIILLSSHFYNCLIYLNNFIFYSFTFFRTIKQNIKENENFTKLIRKRCVRLLYISQKYLLYSRIAIEIFFKVVIS